MTRAKEKARDILKRHNFWIILAIIAGAIVVFWIAWAGVMVIGRWL
jgi:hypothetical protein